MNSSDKRIEHLLKKKGFPKSSQGSSNEPDEEFQDHDILKEKIHDFHQLQIKTILCGALFVTGLCIYGFIYLQILSSNSRSINLDTTIVGVFGNYVYPIGTLSLLVGIIGGLLAIIFYVQTYLQKRHLLKTYQITTEDLKNPYLGG